MVLAFGPRSRKKPEKPIPLPPGARRRGAPRGREGCRNGGSGRDCGRAGGGTVAPAAQPASGAPDALQRLATRVQEREESKGPARKSQHGEQVQAAAPRPQPRHLQSAAVGKLQCCPAPNVFEIHEPWSIMSQGQEDEGATSLYQPLPPALQPQPQAHNLSSPRAAQLPSPAAVSEVPHTDFSRRDAARLGGDGVAGIFGGTGDGGSVHKSGSYMAALSGIKAGLSDAQKAKQAAQREQLKRELEEQIKEKRTAEARRKAELAAQEEEEERKLRAYWAAQAAQAAAERQGPVGRSLGGAGTDRAQLRGGGTAAPVESVAKGRALQARGTAEPTLGTASGHAASKRGEALVQPGVTVFLPPDREAERRGALEARQAAESRSQDAEAVRPQPAGGSVQQVQSDAGQGQAAVAAWQQLQALAGGQYPAAAAAALLAQQQAAATLLAATNPGMAAGGLPLFPYSPMLLPSLAAAGAVSGAGLSAGTAQQAPAAPFTTADPQVLGLLREVQHEQQRMREQLEVVAGDVTAARSERDKARQDLERVQRLLAERQAGQPPAWAAAHAASPGAGFSSDGGLLAVTSHVLPIGVARIPSRLGSPAANSAVSERVEGAPLPARYRRQPLEPWQTQEQQAGGRGTAIKNGASSKSAGKRQGWGQPGAGLQGKGKAAQAAPKQEPPRGWRK